MTIKEYYTEKFLGENGFNNGFVSIQSAEQLEKLTELAAQGIFINSLLNTTLDYQSIIITAKQKLAPGGKLLVFLGSIAPSLDGEPSYWGFTIASAKYMFEKHFDAARIVVASYGNVLVGRFLLNGQALNELKPAELEHTDPFYPVYVGVACTKE